MARSDGPNENNPPYFNCFAHNSFAFLISRKYKFSLHFNYYPRIFFDWDKIDGQLLT